VARAAFLFAIWLFAIRLFAIWLFGFYLFVIELFVIRKIIFEEKMLTILLFKKITLYLTKKEAGCKTSLFWLKRIIVYISNSPWTIWIVQAIFKAIIKMQFNVLIPDVKVITSLIGYYFLVAITSNYGVSS